MPAVSIIMPVYNVEKYVGKAIESILIQTFKDFELIIINDGTIDNSMSIVNELASKDSRIRIINQKNKGLSAARNTGLRSAIGDYVCFIDSDDEVNVNLLRITMDNVIGEYPDVLMFGMFLEKIGSNEKVTFTIPMKMGTVSYTKKNIEDFNINKNSLNLIGYATNKLYKRSVLVDHQIFFDEKIYFLEDINFNEKVFKNINKFMIIDDCLYHYKRRKRTTLMNTFRKEFFECQMEAIRSRNDIFDNWGIEQTIIDATIASLHIEAIKGCISNLFVIKNSISFLNKYKIINEILENSHTQSRIKNFEPNSLVEKLLKYLIEKKISIALAVASTMYSYIYRIVK
ncbi:glycosyltransferase family 2 protein [Alkalibacterium sp. f15]|uniref:glycosyltransferase family 2 protein n=1 Tax=Alkalibacterium sp. f15 TaxID=3414029 RepID=UPI003BF8930F